MDDWLRLQNASSWFYLNSFSVGALIPVAFFVITGFFLLSVKHKSKATLHMGICYTMMGVFNLGYVISSSIYHPAAVYHRWMAIPAILLAEIHATMLFFYYPDERNPRATRWYFRSAYAFVICVCLYFFFETLHAEKVYVILGQYWDFNAIRANKIIALVVLGFILVVPVLTLWRVFTCRGKERRIVFLLGCSLVLGSLVPSIFNLLSRDGIVDRNAFQMSWAIFTMSGFFLAVMLYVNNAREKISFVGKLITVTAITILAILHFISHYSLKDTDRAFDETHVKDALLVLNSDFLPADLAYKAVFDLSGGTLAESDGGGLPVDKGDIERQLYNTAMVEKIRRLPESGFLEQLDDLLAETPPHFDGYKKALLAYAPSLDPSKEAPKREILEFLRRLNAIVFVQYNKISRLSDEHFREELTAYVNKGKDGAADAFQEAIEKRLSVSPREGSALKAEMLTLLVPMTGQEQRIYRASTDGDHRYIAYAVIDFPAEKMIEAGFHYRNYRRYMHDAVLKFVIMIVILLVLSRYGFYWFFYGLLVTPLKALTKGVHAVEAGDLDVNVPVHVEDEIGYITHAFNTMVASIREAKTRLQDDASSLLAAHASLETSHQEIRRLQHYLSNIIQSMPSVLISVDENGSVTQWNEAAEGLTGIRAGDILGKILWQVPSPLKKLERSYREVLVSRKPLLLSRERLEYAPGGEKGGPKYYNIALYPLTAEGISGAVVRIDDITELEKMEQQLRQAQKMDIIGTLAGGIAHDFNNILGGIVGTLSILRYKLEQGMPFSRETAGEYLDIMERAGARATDMVQQLLTLSRKQELAFAPVDLNMTIRHVVKICENTFDKAIEINTVFWEGSPMAAADPGQLEQTLLNLCVNAAHSMTIMRPAGDRKGGILTISLKSMKADQFFCARHPEARPDENYWALSVQDTGVGMDAGTISRIFDPFFTTKETGTGTGLGLTMVYNIIQQHKGFIEVYSEMGRGSLLTVYLPQLKEKGNASPEKAQQALPKGEGCILVIDDEEIMREMAKSILTECGYTVLLAENGKEGLEIFAKEHPRIVMVLMDMVMPKMSGKETFLKIRQVDRGAKVLLTSGFSKNEDISGLLKQGGADFIQKPYTIEQLALKTNALIRRTT